MKSLILLAVVLLVGCSGPTFPSAPLEDVSFSQPDVDFAAQSNKEALAWASSGGAK